MHTAVSILHLRSAAELFFYFLFFVVLSFSKNQHVCSFCRATTHLLLRACPCCRRRAQMLLSMQTISLMPYFVLRERKMKTTKQTKHDRPKTNIYMYKVMYTIYSNTFQNRQTLKSLAKISIFFFLNPLGNLLYLDCTIYVYMSNHEGPKQQK